VGRRRREWVAREQRGRVFSSVFGGAAGRCGSGSDGRLNWLSEHRETEMVLPASDRRFLGQRRGSGFGRLEARRQPVRYRIIRRASLKPLRTPAGAVFSGRCRKAAVFSARTRRNRRPARTCKQGRFSCFARRSSQTPPYQLQTATIQNITPSLRICIGRPRRKTTAKTDAKSRASGEFFAPPSLRSAAVIIWDRPKVHLEKSPTQNCIARAAVTKLRRQVDAAAGLGYNHSPSARTYKGSAEVSLW